MAWTHFKLTELGERTVAKVNGILATLGVWYASTDVLTIEKNNPAHLGEPFDFYKYQTTDGDINSNQANIIVNCPPDLLIPPTSSNEVVVAAVETDYDLIDYIPYSNGVDRIRIVDFENIGNLLLGVSPIFPNYVIMHYDFENIIFRTGLGTGEPYQKIQYQVGNSAGYNPTIYEVDFNIVGTASLFEITESDGTEINMPDSPDIRYFEATFKITNGRANGTALLEMNINLDAAAWPPSTDNSLILSYNSDSIDRQANGIENLTIQLDENGEMNFDLQMGFNTTDLPITGDIIFTLLEINGDALLVGSPDIITYTISF